VISDLNRSLGSRYFVGVLNERTSFASCASAFKSAGWSLVWNELLSGGCEKILPVSGSFWSNLEFLRIMDLTEWL